MYKEALYEFEKIASVLSLEDLEVYANEVLAELEKEAFLFHNYNKDYDKLVAIDPDIKTLDRDIVVNQYLKPGRKKERALYNKPEAFAGFLKERYNFGEEMIKKQKEVPGYMDAPTSVRDANLKELDMLVRHKRNAGLMSDEGYNKYQGYIKTPYAGYDPSDVVAAKYVAGKFTSNPKFKGRKDEVAQQLLSAQRNTDRVSVLKSLYTEDELNQMTAAGYDVDNELLKYLRRHKFYDGPETTL